MKKIYMGLCLTAMLFTLPDFNLFAQSNLASCFGSPSSAPTARVFHLKGFNSPGPLINTLSFTDIPVGTTLRIFSNPTPGAPPLVSYTILPGDNGKFIWSYPNNTANPPVVMCVSAPGQTCCPKAVPALSDCAAAGGPPVNYKPFVDAGQCRMLIQVNVGEAIQLLDAAGQVIPNVVEVQARANLGNGKEIACVSYPCSTTIGSITACGSVNCCSAPFVAAGALPIILIDFKASLNQQGKAVLNWASAIEIDSKSYIIEKSTNGINFSPVGQIDAAGQSRSAFNYSFTDKNSIAGRTYYRLKMLDTDGKFEYSKVVYVNGKVGNVVTAGPNPFITSIQLYGIPSADVNVKNVQVLNAVGQRINFTVTGANTITLNDNAPAGMYIVKVKDQQFKMLKQ
jgi:hypothetical protein